MANSQLYQLLKASGYTLTQAAAKIGFSYGYLSQIVVGERKLTDSARLKIVRAFPETAAFLLQIELPGVMDVHNNPQPEDAQ